MSLKLGWGVVLGQSSIFFRGKARQGGIFLLKLLIIIFYPQLIWSIDFIKFILILVGINLD